MTLPLYPPASPRLLVSTSRSDFLGRLADLQQRVRDVRGGRRRGRRPARRSSAYRLPPAVARSRAFLNRAVAISSIVRVILRMFCTDLRRLTIARALAIGGSLVSPSRDLEVIQAKGDRLVASTSAVQINRSRGRRAASQGGASWRRPGTVLRLELVEGRLQAGRRPRRSASARGREGRGPRTFESS